MVEEFVWTNIKTKQKRVAGVGWAKDRNSLTPRGEANAPNTRRTVHLAGNPVPTHTAGNEVKHVFI